jgi:hypothetical protein
MRRSTTLRLADWATYIPLGYLLIHGRPLWQQLGLVLLLLVHGQILHASGRESARREGALR